MANHTFSNVKALMKSVGAHLVPDAAADPAGPEGVYIVDNSPVMFVAKRAEGAHTRVALKRLDWKSLSAGARFRARLLSIFGLAMSRKTYLSAAHADEYRKAMLRVEQASQTHATGQKLLLSRLRIGTSRRPVDSPPDGASASALPNHDVATLRGKVIAEFSERLDHIMPSLRQQYLCQTVETADRAALKALKPIRVELKQRLDSFAAAGVIEAGSDAIVRALGFEQSIARWSHVCAQYSDPASRRVAMSLQQVDYRLDEIPNWQMHIDPTADAVLGDLHGNCRLLLHSLVSLRFFTIKSADAWNAVSAQLATLETNFPDNDWQSFRLRLSNAIEPVAGAGDRRLTLIGDVLADRRGNDMFMAAILAHLDDCELDFECIFGNHEGEFLSYFLKNRGRHAASYSMKGTGVRMDDDQSRSLVRLQALLQQQPGAVPEFERMVESGFLKHLKLASFSRTGAGLYTHAFANGPLLSSLFAQTGVRHNRHITEQIRELNERFQRSVLGDWEQFSRVYHDNRWGGEGAPVSPLRAVAWNVGMERSECASDPAHANNAGLELPGIFSYAVHGHCGDVALRVRRMAAQIEEVRQLAHELLPLTDTRPRMLSGVRPYLPTLNAALARIDGTTPFKALDLLAPFIARRLRELAQAPEAAEANRIISTLSNEQAACATRAKALSDFWNSHCRAGKGTQNLDLAALPEPVQARLLTNVSEWLQEADGAWSASARLTVKSIGDDAEEERIALTKAIRQNLGIEESNAPLSEEELDTYLAALKRRYFSIDDPAGMLATDTSFSRLVQTVNRLPHVAANRFTA